MCLSSDLSSLPVSCPMDSLPQIIRQYRVMVSSGYRIIFLLSSTGGLVLPFIPFSLIVSYQAFMETPLPKFHPPGDPCPDLPGPADTQCLCENDMGKDEWPLGVPGPPEYPPPLRS